MFTGIIQEIGILKKKIGDGRKNPVRLVILNKKLKFREGESVSVNGVCLTVTQQAKNGFGVDVIPETLRRSNFVQVMPGAALNLEPSMKARDRFHGHFVSGHVDAAAKVLRLEKNKHGVRLAIELPKKFRNAIPEKGSIALNGVSLTVAKVIRNQFVIALIPYTLQHTNLGKVKSGDFVNIEIDMMVRYGARSPEIPRRGAVKIAIIASKFNKEISDRLVSGALRAFHNNKFSRKNVDIFHVPGAFEIPFFIQKLMDRKKYRGFVALGSVIRGETDHYRAVCDGVTFGIQKISMENRVPVMFGVLMCKTKQQALARSGNNAKNKGYECGKGLIEVLGSRK
jgi:riboflavin synthase